MSRRAEPATGSTVEPAAAPEAATEPGPGYVLAWPHRLVRAELTDLLAGVPPPQLRDALALLAAEAFTGP